VFEKPRACSGLLVTGAGLLLSIRQEIGGEVDSNVTGVNSEVVGEPVIVFDIVDEVAI
jgi:hypothetical protein